MGKKEIPNTRNEQVTLSLFAMYPAKHKSMLVRSTANPGKSGDKPLIINI